MPEYNQCRTEVREPDVVGGFMGYLMYVSTFGRGEALKVLALGRWKIESCGGGGVEGFSKLRIVLDSGESSNY